MRRIRSLLVIVLVLAAAIAPGQSPGESAPPAAQLDDYFETRVRPVLAENCLGCHGASKQKGGLRLDSRAGALAGGESGSAVVPGKPEESLLVRAVRREGEPKMPPKGRLPEDAVEALARWVAMGAPWPARAEPSTGSAEAALAAVPHASAARHWAFEPVRPQVLPDLAAPSWCASPVDRFVGARLEAAGLGPSPAADRRTLIRRLSFDLAGLPPSADEIESFLAEEAPDALERLLDRLLASPRYGERWGRHWMDVARYADTTGYLFTQERRFPYSFTYRDYVIRALNADLPYDRFIVEQLAADQLELGDDKRPLAAMGFLTLGRRFLNNLPDIVDDRIDVVCRGLMGLTVQCARCHDHKYDPIPTDDYYSLYGVFASSVEPGEQPLIDAPGESESQQDFEAKLTSAQTAVGAFRTEKHADLTRSLRLQAGEYLLAAARRPVAPSADAGVSLGPADLRPRVIERWRDFIDKSRSGHDPVLAPWHALAALANDDFAARAVELVKSWGRPAAEGQRINRRVLATLSENPPATLEDAARRYGEVFAAVERAAPPAAAGPSGGASTGAVERLDADDDEIRQLLCSEGSPAAIAPREAERLFDRATKNRLRELEREVDGLKASHPGAPARAMTLVDAPAIAEQRVFVRGKSSSPGKQVPRQFLAVLTGAERRPFVKGSGRMELAEAIASPTNPLTARVLANRVWMHHLGRPIVDTPSDFGLRSEAPSHPELLDFLAASFVARGWSLKQLHRLILTSSTYAQASDVEARARSIDPENRLLGRMNRRRLELEPLRDATLEVSGQLDLAMGGKSVELLEPPYSRRRTVYGFIDRQNVPGVFRAFDVASPDTTVPQRHQTTVPQQALFLMNSPFAQDAASALAARAAPAGRAVADCVHALFLATYGRVPDAEEIEAAMGFLNSGSREPDADLWSEYAQVLLLANEFAYVD